MALRREPSSTTTLARLVAIGLLAGGIAPPRVDAEQVAVRVREEGGRAVRELRVRLVPLGFRGPIRRDWERRTDEGGVALFESVAPGDHDIRLYVEQSEALVDPRHDPFAGPTTVRVEPGDPPRTTDLTLRRGAPLSVRFLSNVVDPSRAACTLRHRDTGFEVRLEDPVNLRDLSLTLAPGIWSLRVDPPSGYLLREIRIDDWPQPVVEPELRAEAEGPARTVEIDFEARARVGGRVAARSGCGVGRVVATLLEPGPWIESARALGAPVPTEVVARVDRYCRYEQVLPDGRWSVRPVGEAMESSEPEQVELVIAPGELGRADFVIHVRDPDEKGAAAGLVGRVVDPDGEPIEGAFVELSVPGGGAPLRSLRSRSWGRFAAAWVPVGELRVVAGHPDMLDAERVLPPEAWAVPMKEFDEYRPPPERVVELVLPPAPVLRVVCRSKGPPEHAVGVRVVVEAEGERTRPGLLASEVMQRHRWHRELRTGGEGRCEARGLSPGNFRLEASLTGERASTHLVRLASGPAESGRDGILFELPEEGSVDLELEVARAGRVLLALACDGNEPLPTAVAVRAVPVALVGEDWRVGDDRRIGERAADLLAAATLRHEEARLAGRAEDELAVGPLERGAWLMAFRPAGFDRWTWYPGVEDLRDALFVSVDGDEDTPLERLGLDCGPSFLIEARPEGDGEPSDVQRAELPDLRDAELRGAWWPLDERRLHEGRGGELLARVTRGELHLSGAEPGPARVEIELRHPLLEPWPVTLAIDEVELRTGEQRVLAAPVRVVAALRTSLGPGRLILRPGHAAESGGAESGDEPDAERVAERHVELGPDGALVPSLPPGPWTAELLLTGAEPRSLHLTLESGRVSELR